MDMDSFMLGYLVGAICVMVIVVLATARWP